jgi:thioredoxin 1
MERSNQLALVLFLAVAGVVVVGNLPGIGRRPRPSVDPGAAPAETSAAGIIHLTAAGFAEVRDQGKPVVIDFWAPWCGPCRTQGPILEQFAGQVKGAALVAKVNVDEEPKLAAQYDVKAIPTLIVLKNGKVTQRLVGVHAVADLHRALAD